MIQFYFLSIFFNVVTGYILLSEDDGDTFEIKPGFSLKDDSVKLVLGILSMVTGVLKLLSPVEGDIPVIGDIVPALTGLASGLVLIFEYYRGKNYDGEGPENFGHILVRNKKIIAFIVIIAAGLHFLFPKALLL